MTILTVAGARPNFVKVAALHKALLAYPHIRHKIAHTGQHQSPGMSTMLWHQLGLPEPDYQLGISGGSHTSLTARTMLAFETTLKQARPDRVVVVGDVNATLACALATAQAGIPLAHVEAGLRSGDNTMPEEINRRLTDVLSDCLLVSEPAGVENLQKEGVDTNTIHLVGNCMIDSLTTYRQMAAQTDVLLQLGLKAGTYVLMTMHRPANVDTREALDNLIRLVARVTLHWPLVFPLHPRTRERLESHGLFEKLAKTPNLYLLEPQGYLEFMHLMASAAAVMTDSGGIQEETTCLQVPCLTLRSTTERPITISSGSNTLFPDANPEEVLPYLSRIFEGYGKKGAVPPLWDGRASDRIAAILAGAH